MIIKFLGTGTSTGVPQIGCNCPTCTSCDSRDWRTRASVIITLDNGRNLLIDCGPDFRQQIINARAPKLEALLITHSHYDHVGGIDDLRPYCKDGRDFPTYCQADVANDLRLRNPWSFASRLYPGVPTFEIHEIEAGQPFTIADTEILPISVHHGKLPILGFRIGPVAYITDCKTMPTESYKALRGIDTLVINALRHIEHHTHMTYEQTLETIKLIGPRRSFLTHVSHDFGTHAQIAVSLPHNINLAYDGLTVEI